MGILNDILSQCQGRLNDRKTALPLRELKSKIIDTEVPRDFTGAVKRPPGEGIRFIAELKKASPSRGLLRSEFNPVALSGTYEGKSVHAISVLTEEDYFRGNIAFIPEIKKAVRLPILRKDFIFDEYQVYESRTCGADAILLIGAILEINQANDFIHLARELGLSVLFEVHDYTDLEKALAVETDIIGINNRNLRTLSVNLDKTFTLMREIPAEKIIVSESGIQTRQDVQTLEDAGVHAILIGTVLMQSRDIEGTLDILMGKTPR
jgi:indole-3-glycerol phosphate synthase